MEFSTSIYKHKMSKEAFECCQIDFNCLCDNNDFAVLTENYSPIATKKICIMITDEELRQYTIKAISLSRKAYTYEEAPELYDKYLEIFGDQAKLQEECRNYYIKNYCERNETYEIASKTSDININENTHNTEQAKRFTARQNAILFFFLCENEKVYLDGETKNATIKKVMEIMATITGYSNASFKGLFKIDYDNESHIKDINYVANTIKEILPETYKNMINYLENNGH